MSVRDRLTEALKFDERIWRAFQVLKPVHRDGLLDALEQALAPASTQERSRHTVRVDSGKYTFIVADGPTILIDRHGERWHAQQEAFNALHSIMSELDAARVVLEAARNLAKRNEAPQELYDALMKHRALVDDQEKPSEWTGASP